MNVIYSIWEQHKAKLTGPPAHRFQLRIDNNKVPGKQADPLNIPEPKSEGEPTESDTTGVDVGELEYEIPQQD